MPHFVPDVPVDSIVCPPQVREGRDERQYLDLRESVRQHGILVPLLGHLDKDTTVLDDGYGRLEIARELAIRAVPMVLGDHAPTPAERIRLQLVIHTHRSDLTIMERTRGIDQLMRSAGLTAAQAASEIGRYSESHISKFLSLLVHPRDVQDLIDAGRIPMSSAYEIAKVADAAERDRLVQAVLDGRLKRDKLAAYVKSIRSAASKPIARRKPRTRPERVVISLGQGRSVAVSAPALTTESVVEWLTELALQLKAVSTEGRSLSEVVKSLDSGGSHVRTA